MGNVDQRGVLRPHLITGACDIGAVEYDYTPTTLTLTSSVNPSDVGQAVTFNATITATSGTPTGTIVFRDGATSLGGGTIGGGAASLTTAALTAGAHTITASYEGDGVFAAAIATVNQQVGPVTPGGPGGPGGPVDVGLQFFPLADPVRLLDTRTGSSADMWLPGHR